MQSVIHYVSLCSIFHHRVIRYLPFLWVIYLLLLFLFCGLILDKLILIGDLRYFLLTCIICDLEGTPVNSTCFACDFHFLGLPFLRTYLGVIAIWLIYFRKMLNVFLQGNFFFGFIGWVRGVSKLVAELSLLAQENSTRLTFHHHEVYPGLLVPICFDTLLNLPA